MFKLKYLIFGENFNQPRTNLPNSITTIGFPSVCPIKNNIPENIETVYIEFDTKNKNNEIVENLPITIKKILVNDISKINLIKKIPFGCVIEEVVYT